MEIEVRLFARCSPKYSSAFGEVWHVQGGKARMYRRIVNWIGPWRFGRALSMSDQVNEIVVVVKLIQAVLSKEAGAVAEEGSREVTTNLENH